MAVIGASSTFPTLLDQAKRRDPNGQLAQVIELLSQVNPMVEDAVAIEGNLVTGHQVSLRTGLPSGKWRKKNEFIQGSKSTSDQFVETCGSLEDYSKVDIAVAKMYADAAAFRADEDDAFLMGMTNKIETSVIYESTKTAPEAIMGFAGRLDSTTGAAGAQVKLLGAGGTNTNTSIWLVGWGKRQVSLIYPKGSESAGLVATDLGEQLLQKDDGSMMRAYVSHFQWELGVAVHDKRYLVRGANIDMATESATGDTIVPFMIDMMGQIHSLNMCKPVFYVSRSLETLLRKQARVATKNSSLTIEDIAGKKVVHMDGIPVRRCDAILNTEAAVA